LNVDGLRWSVSTKRNPMDIVMKYFQRGFGTLLSSADTFAIIKYVNACPYWPEDIVDDDHWVLYASTVDFIFHPSWSKIGIYHYINADSNNVIKNLQWASLRGSLISHKTHEVKNKYFSDEVAAIIL
jgi:hypothetical protein